MNEAYGPNSCTTRQHKQQHQQEEDTSINKEQKPSKSSQDQQTRKNAFSNALGTINVMSGVEDFGSPATVAGDNPDEVSFEFIKQPSMKGLPYGPVTQQPGDILVPHLTIRLTGAVDPFKNYSATATVVQYMDASDKHPQPMKLDPHVFSRPEPGSMRDEGSTIDFVWNNLRADEPGWYYVNVTLLDSPGMAMLPIAMRSSEKFLAKKL